MSNKLFVYGTLGPGRPNEHILTDIGGVWQTGSITGKLHQEGWGAEMGYPGITLDEGGNKVEGFLFTSDQLSAHWPALDDFEGSAYERVLTKVELENGSYADAYVYTLKRKSCS